MTHLLLALLTAAGMGQGIDADLIEELGHRSWKVRARAQSSVTRAEIADLRRVALSATDPEVKQRLWQIYQKKNRQPLIEKQLDLLRPFPMIDANWMDWKTLQYTGSPQGLRRYLRQAYRQELRHINCALSWLQWREASYLWARDLLQAGVPLWMIESHFGTMHRLDRRWCSDDNLQIPYYPWTETHWLWWR